MYNQESDALVKFSLLGADNQSDSSIFHKFHQLEMHLPHFYPFDDLPIALDREVLHFSQRADARGKIPRDYFSSISEYLDQLDIPQLLRYLLIRHHYSVRSKVEQSGLDIQPQMLADRGFSTLKITQESDHYTFPLEVWNVNPHSDLRLPRKPSPLMRFFIPSPPLRGRSLVESAQRIGFKDPMFRNYQNKLLTQSEVSQLSPNHPLLDKDSPKSLEFVSVGIVKEAQYAGKKVIDINKVLTIPHYDRARLDEELGLKWDRENIPSETYRGNRIGETSPVKFPLDLVGVIAIEIPLDDKGLTHHSASPLINAGFGSNTPNGLPIRVEIDAIESIINKRIHFRLFSAIPTSESKNSVEI